MNLDKLIERRVRQSEVRLGPQDRTICSPTSLEKINLEFEIDSPLFSRISCWSERKTGLSHDRRRNYGHSIQGQWREQPKVRFQDKKVFYYQLVIASS